MKDTKFIVVQDTKTANGLISAGFQVVTHVNDRYIFLNVIPKHFMFENIDVITQYRLECLFSLARVARTTPADARKKSAFVE